MNDIENKYLSKYNNEIDYIYKEKSETSKEQDNKIFVEILKNNYMKSLFYCHYNTGIIGIEGYLGIHFKNYLDTVETIYLINYLLLLVY